MSSCLITRAKRQWYKYRYHFTEMGAQPTSSSTATGSPTRANWNPWSLTITISSSVPDFLIEWPSKWGYWQPHNRDCSNRKTNQLVLGGCKGTQWAPDRSGQCKPLSQSDQKGNTSLWARTGLTKESQYRPLPRLTWEPSVLDEESPANVAVRLGQEVRECEKEREWCLQAAH